MILNDQLIIHESSIILEELQQPHGVTSLEWWWMQGELSPNDRKFQIFSA